jgi:diguanylate cyclase (GGDEF)-like protein
MALAEQQLKVAERSNTRLLLLFADVDDLKSINDKLGHLKGDDAIVEAATILKEIFRESDIIARVGGDEFVVLAYGVSTESTGVPEYRLQEQMDAHNARENRDYKISMSIGIAYKDPDWSCSIDELMSHADTLMYQQKKLRKIEERQDSWTSSSSRSEALISAPDSRSKHQGTFKDSTNPDNLEIRSGRDS